MVAPMLRQFGRPEAASDSAHELVRQSKVRQQHLPVCAELNHKLIKHVKHVRYSLFHAPSDRTVHAALRGGCV